MDQHDIARALALEAPTGRRGLDLRWLSRSHAAPREFFTALHGVLNLVAELGPKSSPERGFDLYHDMVARHVGAGRAALRFHDPHAPIDDRWVTLTFDELHARCSVRAASWASQGVEPGSTLCVVLPFDVECVVALLTGLRLGACISLLEPEGPDYLGLRLATLAPQFVASEAHYRPRLGDLDALPCTWLGERLAGPAVAGSHCYLPGEPCALLFSPLRQPAHVPVAVSAEAAFFGALRDGAVALALRPGDALAAPGFDVLQHQPGLLFAALVMGASFVHVAAESVIREPSLLRASPLRSVGLTAAVGEALVAGPARSRPAWDHVFKNPEEPTDWEAWRELIEALELGDTPMSNLLIEAASGGCLLSSPRRPAKQQLARLMEVTSAAGRAWTLLDFTGSGQLAVGDVGLFAPREGVHDQGDEGAPEPRHFVLGRRRGVEYLYGGTLEPRRAGRVYPAREVLDTLADCPFLHAASIVSISAGGPTLEHRFVLLGFTGAEPRERFLANQRRRVDELVRVLATRLSRDHLPDRVELFPCHARMSEGEVDHRWCREQYLGGVLARKLRSPVFERLTALRAALAVTEPA
ncbi:long-chain fatty acid--CoA ligase [Nannocystaceae bacterium ST9]